MELPNWAGASTIYVDFETSSRDPKKSSTNPWRDCYACGVAVTVDTNPESVYIPFGHHSRYRDQVPKETVRAWLHDLFVGATRWVNSNVKYDAHVLHNDFGIDPLNGKTRVELIDLIVLAKLVETDREYKGGYGLDRLADWLLDKDITDHEYNLYRYLSHTKDYGEVPPDIMAPYAKCDVETARDCYHVLLEKLHPEAKPLFATEVKVTRVLAKLERRGLLIDEVELYKAAIENLLTIVKLTEKVHKLTGRYLNVNSNTAMTDYVCNVLGLPVMRWTNADDDSLESRPSFNKYAIQDYLICREAPKEFFEIVLSLRDRKTFQTYFLDPYTELSIGNLIHPTVNQSVRTGRMSCSDPNMQQLTSAAKQLVVPREGNSILRWDYCNIEYRYIAHYIQAREVIETFRVDPDADFHSIVAKLCGIPRRPAKTVNFLSAYGGGIARLLQALAALEDVCRVAEDALRGVPSFEKASEETRNILLKNKIKEKAEQIHADYHRNLPTLRPTAKRAENLCKRRGYIQNMFGRRRHLPPDHAYAAFNSLCQGAAADLMKAKMVQLDEAFEPLGVYFPCPPVHDELISEGPTELVTDPRFIRDATAIMEDTDTLVEGRSIKISVPIRTDYGVSSINWKEAADDKNKKKLPVSELTRREDFTWVTCQ